MNVTKERCDDRHKKWTLAATLFVALTVVFLMLATFAIQQAADATDRACRVEQKFEAKSAAQDVMNTHIMAALERIERRLDELRTAKGSTP